jgi:hypothetical protein
MSLTGTRRCVQVGSGGTDRRVIPDVEGVSPGDRTVPVPAEHPGPGGRP